MEEEQPEEEEEEGERLPTDRERKGIGGRRRGHCWFLMLLQGLREERGWLLERQWVLEVPTKATGRRKQDRKKRMEGEEVQRKKRRRGREPGESPAYGAAVVFL